MYYLDVIILKPFANNTKTWTYQSDIKVAKSAIVSVNFHHQTVLGFVIDIKNKVNNTYQYQKINKVIVKQSLNAYQIKLLKTINQNYFNNYSYLLTYFVNQKLIKGLINKPIYKNKKHQTFLTTNEKINNLNKFISMCDNNDQYLILCPNILCVKTLAKYIYYNPQLLFIKTDQDYIKAFLKIKNHDVNIIISTYHGLFLPFTNLKNIIVIDHYNDQYLLKTSPYLNISNILNDLNITLKYINFLNYEDQDYNVYQDCMINKLDYLLDDEFYKLIKKHLKQGNVYLYCPNLENEALYQCQKCQGYGTFKTKCSFCGSHHLTLIHNNFDTIYKQLKTIFTTQVSKTVKPEANHYILITKELDLFNNYQLSIVIDNAFYNYYNLFKNYDNYKNLLKLHKNSKQLMLITDQIDLSQNSLTTIKNTIKTQYQYQANDYFAIIYLACNNYYQAQKQAALLINILGKCHVKYHDKKLFYRFKNKIYYQIIVKYQTNEQLKMIQKQIICEIKILTDLFNRI